MIRALTLLILLTPAIAFGGGWPATAPRIGKLVTPQEYWIYTLGAARDYRVKPSVIQGVMAIESRYNRWASSGRGRCRGLMQLDREASQGINPWDARQNIRRGTFILARLLKKHHGNLRQVVREYNGTGDQSYLREVLKAIKQAEQQLKGENHVSARESG